MPEKKCKECSRWKQYPLEQGFDETDGRCDLFGRMENGDNKQCVFPEAVEIITWAQDLLFEAHKLPKDHPWAKKVREWFKLAEKPR